MNVLAMLDNSYEIKSLNVELPEPIAFNCWKHHLGFVNGSFQNQTNYTKSDPFIREIIQFIGNSQFDFYIGNQTPLSIANEILSILEKNNAIALSDYTNWLLSDGADYRCVSISDGSNWTLRLGQGNRYVHIHPSRHSKKTIRVKSSSLKSVYAFLFYYGTSEVQISVEKINFVRNRIAKLPSLKLNSPLAAITRLINLFSI